MYGGRKPIHPGEYEMSYRIQRIPSVNNITLGYGGEPSAFACEIQMIFTRACNKAITDLKKKDLQPGGLDILNPKMVSTQRKEDET
jgi:hypothetical protein